jgi:hypothetical protein
LGAIHVCGTHHMGNFFSFDDGSDALILEEKKKYEEEKCNSEKNPHIYLYQRLCKFRNFIM